MNMKKNLLIVLSVFSASALAQMQPMPQPDQPPLQQSSPDSQSQSGSSGGNQSQTQSGSGDRSPMQPGMQPGMQPDNSSSGGYQPQTGFGSGNQPPMQPGAPSDTSSGGSSPQTQSGGGERSGVPSQTQSNKLPPPPPMTQLAPKENENGVKYLCGGVGEDETNQLKQAARDYDMMLTFAARNGAFLADVNVDISDTRGKSLLKTTCDGPIMLVDLPKSGTYRVRAETGGYTLTRTVKVPTKGRGKAVVFVWPTQVSGSDQAGQPSRPGAGATH